MKTLVQETFENEFNEAHYKEFVKNLFNHFDFSKEHTLKHQFNNAERQVLNDFTYLGTYKEAEKKCLDVLTVELKSSSKVERARSLQRNLIGKYLKTNIRDSALVAFYSKDNPDWRLSFVKIDYRLDKSGLKVEIGTPPKRYSFLVGKTEPSYTAKKQLLPLLDDKVIPTVVEVEQSFDIEVVTKEFYKDFVSIYLLLKEEIEKDMRFKNKADKEAQTILDRLLFLYFIQKKGWLNSNRNFLYESFKKICENDNKDDYSFYKKVVFPLFHALSDEDYKSEELGDIPFLNGGLFEITKNDFINQINLSVSNNVFNEIFNNLLELYNFTVYEGTPIDIEVAIDPEMLGKIFENLILQREKNPEKDLRKATGSYYTPRINVHFMCQQALQEYITSEGIIEESKLNQIFTIAKDISVIMSGSKNLEGILTVKEASQLKDLILKAKIIDLAVGSGAFIVGILHEMLSIIRLCDVRISGLNILNRANYDYELKRKIIEHCLYGVDIQEEAVRICELRLWLSLIVDYQIDSKKPFPLAIKEIPTLPNLSYRICHGDSLIEKLYGHSVQLDKLPPTDKGRQLIDQINAEKDAYFLAKDIKDKQKKELNILVKQAELAEFLIEEKRKALISEAQSQTSLLEETTKEQKAREYYETLLKEYSEIKERSIANKIRLKEMLTGKRPVEMKDINSLRKKMGISFIWRLDFAEVFKEKEGFDIITANPPYVRADSPDPNYLIFRRQLEDSKTYKTLYEKWDLFIPFIEKGLTLLNKKGNLKYITSNSLCTSKFAHKLLDLVQKEYRVSCIDYFEDMEVFEDIGVIPIIIGIKKDKDATSNVIKRIRNTTFENIRKEEIIKSDDFVSLGRDAFRKDFQEIRCKLKSDKLGDICYLSKGMVINADEKKWKNEFQKNDLISDKPTTIHTKCYVEGKYISPYVIHKKKYLEWNTKRVPKKLSRPTFPELYDRPKILKGRVTGAIYDDNNLTCNDSIVVFVRFADLAGVNNKSISGSIRKFNTPRRSELEEGSKNYDLKYLLAILNSKYANFFLNNHRRHRLENYFYPNDFRNLPIPQINLAEQKPFIKIVDQILSITKDEDYLQNLDKQAKVYALERQIDKMVYELYELTPKEIEVVEGKR